MAMIRTGGGGSEEVIVLLSSDEEESMPDQQETSRISASCAKQVVCSNSLEEEERLHSRILWKEVPCSPNSKVDTKTPVPVALTKNAECHSLCISNGIGIEPLNSMAPFPVALLENKVHHSPCLSNGLSPEVLTAVDKPKLENVIDSKVAAVAEILPDKVIKHNEVDKKKAQSEHAIEHFFIICQEFLEGEDGCKILARVKKLYSSADPAFVYSPRFCDFVNRKSKEDLNASNVYIHLKEVCDQLKFYRQRKKSLGEKAVESRVDNVVPCERTSISTSNNSSVTVPNCQESKTEHETPSSMLSRRQPTEKQIRRLEHLLERLDRKIKHLQKKELNLDNLDDSESVYILEDKYKKRFVKVWNKLCELNGQSPRTGREVEKKFRFNGSRYPEVNEKVSKFVNKTKTFPDYSDVLGLVSSLNSALRLHETQLHALAREVFEEVGKILKMRRWKDNVELMGCSLTDFLDSTNDPAELNKELRLALQENHRKASKDLDEIIDKYAMKQSELKLEPEAVKDDDKSEHSSDEENDDEHESEESDVEQIEKTVASDDEEDTVATKENKEEECVKEFPSHNEILASQSPSEFGNTTQESMSTNSSALPSLPRLDLPCTSSSVPPLPAFSSGSKRSTVYDYMPSQAKIPRLENNCLSDFTNIKTFQEVDDDVIILE